MKILDKIKNAIFEEVPAEDVDTNKEPVVEKEEKIVKKIDVEKTIQELPKQEEKKEVVEKRVERPKKQIIFNDEDFLSETREINMKRQEPKLKEKPLYGGSSVKDEKPKEKFKPSPIISPVYGLVADNSGKSHENGHSNVMLDDLLKEEKKKEEVTFDTIRRKAFGDTDEVKEEKSLLYEMKEEDDIPSIEKVTLGDAEEYFNDLGLEYEVDYKDEAKAKLTRSTKNKELTEIVEEEIKGEEEIQNELSKSKSTKSKEKSKITKLDEAKTMTDTNDVEEKNLYDLIDMMYDSKE